MVKKIFYPLFAAAILLFAESALAEQIDAQQARQQAMAFLNRNATTKKMLKGGNADLQLATLPRVVNITLSTLLPLMAMCWCRATTVCQP